MSVAAYKPRSLAELLRPLIAGEVQANELLAPKVSFRSGGSADVFVRPASVEDLLTTLKVAREAGCPLNILGGGANTLVADAGVRGITVKLPADLFDESVAKDSDSGRITLGCGAAIARLIQKMKSAGLVGAEFLAGIPGTLGGAVAMNAGTKMGECMTVVESIEVATADGVGWLSKVQYRYRKTLLPANSVVTRVRFHLPQGDLGESQRKMDEDLAYRKRTQPLDKPNFGSVFQNPPGDHAGRLIEAVGLKAHRIGSAQISSLHANWIVNLGGARTAEVLQLIAEAQRRVKNQFGVDLVPEVQRVGSFE
jgi:UDP-N-acetylmuramate dehydrogenase